MRCIHLLAFFFLLLGCDGESSIEKIPKKLVSLNVSAVRKVNKFISADYYEGLNSQQLIRFEQTLTNVYKSFFGSPPMKLTVRRNNEGKSGLANTVSIIGDAVTNNLKSLFQKFGISKSSNNAAYNSMVINSTTPLRFSIFYQLMKMPLEMRPILHEIQNRIDKYMKKNNYGKFGYKGRTIFSLKNSDGNNNSSMMGWEKTMSLKFLKTWSVHFHDCLDSNKSKYFDIKRTVGNLINSTPETTSRIIYRRLRKPIPEHPLIRETEHSEMEAFFCHAIAGEKWYDYHDCLTEMKRVNNCMTTELEDFSKSQKARSRIGEESKKFIKTVRSLDESCVNVEDNEQFLIECKNIGRNKLKNNDHSYVRDFIMGDLKTSPVLRRMADEVLVTIVGTSGPGVDALRKMATLVRIYENGLQARKKLEKNKTNDAQKYNELTENLADYERHVARMSFKMIGNANEIVSNMEMILADSASKVSRHNLSGNVVTLKCFSDLIKAIFVNLYENKTTNSIRNSNEAFNRHSIKSIPNDDDSSQNPVGFLKNSLDESLKNWMSSLKRMAETSTFRHRHSTALISLANTFLLATVFYECIALLATSIYRERDREPSAQSNDEEHFSDDHWTSGERKTDRRRFRALRKTVRNNNLLS